MVCLGYTIAKGNGMSFKYCSITLCTVLVVLSGYLNSLCSTLSVTVSMHSRRVQVHGRACASPLLSESLLTLNVGMMQTHSLTTVITPNSQTRQLHV